MNKLKHLIPLASLVFLFSLAAYSEEPFDISLDGAYEGFIMELDSYTFTSENGREVMASGFYYHKNQADPQRPVIFCNYSAPTR
ncbi:hypothetical protein NX722_04140 [Endozoicomonas gorgoniicola]|uniref:Uncharacterized protein n=1 Tax=Endozoicomonas gorgoniicola TaxID=1234144 RepID=A0ABT3MR41_9GAMM|nr:hypothetical protein [Endozoicomonas gorgoniicola]MCW7551842.1 hypothetical protein [Endozoicomonas gorgoniicola]